LDTSFYIKHHINMRFQFTLHDDEHKNALVQYVFHISSVLLQLFCFIYCNLRKKLTTNDSLIIFTNMTH